MKPLLDEGDADSDVLALAGEVYMRNGDMAEAERYFAKAAALDPKNSSKRTAVALSHMAMGDSERGLRELEEVAATDTGIRADLALIMANIQQRKFDAALAAIAALEKKQPDKPLPHNLRGAVLLAKGDHGGRAGELRARGCAGPGRFRGGGEPRQARSCGQEAGRMRRRGSKRSWPRTRRTCGRCSRLAELRAQAGGTPDEVAALIGKAVAADPTSSAPRLALISHYLRSKEPKKAVAAAQDALAALPDRADILYAAGQAQQAAGETNQAIATYNKLAQLRPGSPLPFMRMPKCRWPRRTTTPRCRACARRWRSSRISSRRSVPSSQSICSAGRTKEALAVAREVQKQRPKESVGYILEGDIHASKKAWSDAVAAYRNGLKQAGTTDLAIRLDAALRASGSDVRGRQIRGVVAQGSSEGSRVPQLSGAERRWQRRTMRGAPRRVQGRCWSRSRTMSWR